MSDKTTVHISGADLRAFFSTAKKNGTVDAWCDCAMQWMAGAEEALAASQRLEAELQRYGDTTARLLSKKTVEAEQLQARLDAAEKDAARYRWLQTATSHQIDIWSCHLIADQNDYADKHIAALAPTVSADEKGEGR